MNRRCALALIAAAAILMVPARDTFAHPIGNFTTNRYSRIDLSSDRIDLIYVVDMAEVPALQEMDRLDANRDGRVDDGEKAAYLSEMAAKLVPRLELKLDNTPVALVLASSNLELKPGQADLQTLRFSIAFSAQPVPRIERVTSMSYRDDNFGGRVGWAEVIVRAGSGVELVQSSAPEADLSDELRYYPAELLNSPPDRREAQATLSPGVGPSEVRGREASGAEEGNARSKAGPQRGLEFPIPSPVIGVLSPFIGDASQGFGPAAAWDLGFLGVALALLLAAFWGATHALSPGHGKTVVAAYLVGTRGTARHALYLGLTVTATHTLGVYLLGLVTLFAAQFLLSESLYPWLSLLSGSAVFLVGAGLLVSRTRGLLRPAMAEFHHHSHQGEEHLGQSHLHEGDRLEHHHGANDNEQAHDHEHHHTHDHSHHGHSHLPIGADGSTVTWRGLLALGVAGGLLPCPSALVLMLGAIAAGQVLFGLVLVVAFSLGLTVVLTGIGLVLVYTRQAVGLRLGRTSNLAAPLLRVAPLGSALLISLLGLAMAIQALVETGLLKV